MSCHPILLTVLIWFYSQNGPRALVATFGGGNLNVKRVDFEGNSGYVVSY